MRQHLAGMGDKQPEEIVFARSQLHFLPADRHDAAHEVDAQLAAAEYRLLALLLQPMAQCRTDAGEELSMPKGFVM